MEQARVGVCPGELTAQFVEDECLDELAGSRVGGVGERARGFAEQPSGEAGVGDEDLRVPLDAAGEVA